MNSLISYITFFPVALWHVLCTASTSICAGVPIEKIQSSVFFVSLSDKRFISACDHLLVMQKRYSKCVRRFVLDVMRRVFRATSFYRRWCPAIAPACNIKALPGAEHRPGQRKPGVG